MCVERSDILNEINPEAPILPSFHLTCFGCSNSHDMYDDLQYGCLMTRCRKRNNKLIPAVHPTVDCKDYANDEKEE